MAPFPVPSTSVTWKQFMPEYLAGVKHRLGDVGLRISTMDANHIGAQIVSMNQPGAQGFTEVDDCIQFCRQVNQFVYDEYIKKHPRRFFAFATLPTQEGKAAAAELERCINEYEGFVGAMINGYTNTKDPETGLYLDDPQFDVLWEVAQRLDKPIFIHPRPPLVSNIRTLADQPVFHGAPYGFGRETVEHCLRLMYAGVFDRFPGLKIALGHMGEGLSWILPRTDSTFRLYTKGMFPSVSSSYLE